MSDNSKFLNKSIRRSNRMRSVNSNKSTNIAPLISQNDSGIRSTVNPKWQPNGKNIVYNKSDCGYPNVRMYGDGGRMPGTACGRFLDAESLNGKYSDADIVWFANYNDRSQCFDCNAPRTDHDWDATNFEIADYKFQVTPDGKHSGCPDINSFKYKVAWTYATSNLRKTICPNTLN